ncbi:MAG: GGDEF domain-containing protein [Spirochaetaceae bacterium]|jgi:diguanylate cyclase (GGDEF)-like protein|nr:GGDEF domain-containing protein [Spirochaetaceae bacterium]
MQNRFFNRIGKWRWYTLSQEDVAECRPGMIRHNAESLSISSALAGLFIITAVFFSNKRGGELVGRTVPLPILIAAAEFSICITINILKRKMLSNAWVVNMLVVISFVLVLINCCYAQVAGQSWMTVEQFWIFFAVFQIVFVYDFVVILAVDALLVLFFRFFLEQYAATADRWQLDADNVLYACAIVAAFTWISSRSMISELALQNRYYKESIHDQLTGLGNRRNFEQTVGFYLSVCRRVHQTICVIMLDVDFFKLYNDTYKHFKGDDVLRQIGRVLRELTESEHVYAARVGGEEFIVLWTENRIAEAKRVARKLRQNIIDLQIPHETSPVSPYVTVSIGLYMMRGGSQDTSEELYRNADTALYLAKEQGRDRIILCDSEDNSFREVLPVPSELNVGRR